MEKGELDQFLKIKGEARGAVFQIDAQYVLSKWGKKGLEKIKNKAKKLGYDIPYEKAEAMNWYPIGLRIISFLLIKESFDLGNEQIREMGSLAPKFSFIVKFLFKLFTPLERFAKDIPVYWKEHYTIGELEVKELDEAKKRIVLLLKEIKFHPSFCLYLEGYFEGVCKFLFPNSQCKETQCIFKGDPIHEYILSWQ